MLCLISGTMMGGEGSQHCASSSYGRTRNELHLIACRHPNGSKPNEAIFSRTVISEKDVSRKGLVMNFENRDTVIP